eukprot:c29085_g1_i5 orf=390-980(+)
MDELQSRDRRELKRIRRDKPELKKPLQVPKIDVADKSSFKWHVTERLCILSDDLPSASPLPAVEIEQVKGLCFDDDRVTKLITTLEAELQAAGYNNTVRDTDDQFACDAHLTTGRQFLLSQLGEQNPSNDTLKPSLTSLSSPSRLLSSSHKDDILIAMFKSFIPEEPYFPSSINSSNCPDLSDALCLRNKESHMDF